MSESEKVDCKSFTEGPSQAFKPECFFYQALQSSPVERHRKVSAVPVSDEQARCQEADCPGVLDFIKASCTLFTKSCKIQKPGLRKSFSCKHKAEKKGINHDELRPVKPLQKTLALQDLLMFCSSSSFVRSSASSGPG